MGENKAGEVRLYQRIGLAAGPLLALIVWLLPAPEGLSEAGWRTAAVGVWMATWWLTEALPMAATAMLPLAVFPLTGVGTIDEAAEPYASPLIFLFLGGFLIAQAMQRWNLHRRIALRTIGATGTRPVGMVLGFMLASAFLSMWVSNTATAMMMMPIGLSVIALLPDDTGTDTRNLKVILMLAIAYACSLGGMGTLIGTPPNALLAGYFREHYDIEIGFAAWMGLAMPIVIIGLAATLYILFRVYPVRRDAVPGGAELIGNELKQLGPVSTPEKRVGIVFIIVAAAWILRPVLDDHITGLGDAGIAMIGGLALFLMRSGRGGALLDWASAERLPWGVLVLFGGGLSFAGAVTRTGLAEWIGNSLGFASVLPAIGLIAVVVTVIVLLTELTSNTATTAAFLPVMASLAVSLGEPAMQLAAPAALAASCAFMLPVATPPNAIVYGSGILTVPLMARAGWAINLLMILVITTAGYAMIGWLFAGAATA